MLSAFTVDVVNTTGAGDTFNGAFACAIARNYALTDATLYATAASGISVSDKTAFDSAPPHEITVDFIARCPYLDTLLTHDEPSIVR
jgi:ribokinase